MLDEELKINMSLNLNTKSRLNVKLNEKLLYLLSGLIIGFKSQVSIEPLLISIDRGIRA
jgi:hypothetical protein